MRSDSKVQTLIGSVPSLSLSASVLQPGPVLTRGAVIADEYRIEHPIARGRTATIYSASHQITGERVAVRVLARPLFQVAHMREQFLRCAALGTRISHPNLVGNQVFGGEQGSVYTVMEWLDGETLADRLARTRLSVADVVAQLMHVFRGIAAAHAVGLIHGDLKPSQVFLSRTIADGAPIAKVFGFGVAVPARLATTLLQSPAHYRAPEQLRGELTPDARSDVYALGVCLFEAISGRKPFSASDHKALIRKIVTTEAPRLTRDDPNIDPQLADVVSCAMARNPDDRFQSVEALALALEPFANVRFRALHSVQRSAAAAQAERRLLATAQDARRRTLLPVTLALVLCTLAGAYVLGSPQRQELEHAQGATLSAEPMPVSVPECESEQLQGSLAIAAPSSCTPTRVLPHASSAPAPVPAPRAMP